MSHPKDFRAAAEISKIYWILLEIWDFCWHSEQVRKRQKFKCFRCPKFSHCNCKKWSTRARDTFHPNAHLSIFSSWGKDFENRLNTFARYGIFAGTLNMLKVRKISNVVDAQSFHLAIAKVKHVRTWNIPPKCPPLNIFELRQRFPKISWILLVVWDFCCHSVQVVSGKISNVVDAQVFALQLQKWNTCAHETFHPKVDPQNFLPEAKISKIGRILLEIQDFGCHSVQLEIGKIANVVEAQTFHLAIATVKYLRT